MDAQYDIQWIQHHNTVEMKNVNELIIEEDEQDSESEYLNESAANKVCFDCPSNLLNNDEATTSTDVDAANIDQIAAENLIFMARDRQGVAEMITDSSEEHAVIVSNGISTHANEYIYTPNTGAEYTDTTPQMVTEEVITDDWVQRQGAERVEIPADQIIGSSSQVVLDIEVPLPTVQDEYTALRPYPCDFCSRRFRKKTSLMNHMVAHQNDRPNLCKLCDSRFFRRSDLISHLKAHADAPDNDRSSQVDLSRFVGQINHKRMDQTTADDHYYDFDDYVASTDRSAKDLNKLANGSSNSSSSTVRTGRVSRLKPKQPAFSVEDTQEMEIVPPISTETEMNCQDLKASTASVKFTQDKQSQSNFFPVIDDSKPFVCQQCGLAFAREKALSAHIKNHRNEAPYECDQCNEMFWDKDTLQDHQKTHQFEASNSEYDPNEIGDESQSDSEADPLYGEFYCSECGVSFHRQDLLMRHTKSHTSGGEVSELLDKSGQHCCNTCGETFQEALDLLAHAEIHARYPPYKCVLCGESFFEETTIKRHLLNQHENAMTINSCILCGKECRDRKALIKHAWDHSREKCHSCPKCGKSFHNKARLKRHMTSHRDKSVICNICFEEFPDGRSLSNHRHSHSTTSAGKLFPCHECGKTFGSRSSQQIHVRIHTGEKPYGCRYCWKAFADGGTLRKHERIHTGEKPYVCSVCSRAFNQRVVLREHIRSHHSGLDIKRGTYFCSLCQENLPTSSDLVQHLIQHSDVNTAKQRKPIAGPRKYKRRRKLKPHEIERLRGDHKQDEEPNDSDVDITDIDDLLGISEQSPPPTSITRSKNTRTSRNEISKRNSLAGNRSKSKAISDELATIDDVSHCSRTRYPSTNSNSEKLWPTRLGNTITHKHDESLLLNVENTLQSIDTLVVGTERESDFSSSPENKTQRIQSLQQKRNAKTLNTSPTECMELSRTRRRTQTASKQVNRPHMIRTEKNRYQNGSNTTTSNVIENKQRRTTTTTTTTATRMLVTRNEASASMTSRLELLPSKALTIVDDYEIISPDTQPPHQISSSPIHIKQEDNEQHFQQYRQFQHQQQQLQQFQQQQQQLLQETNSEQRRRRRYLTSQSSQTSRSSDLYDAQLLLEAATLRKDCYEKFNPSIVNDLEEILRSPLKTDKIGERMRNTSECSTTQYLGDQSEEEAGLIKLEPNSPDFHSLFNCTGENASTSNHKTPERMRTCRNRQVTPNRRYLQFETSSSPSPNTRQAASRQRKSSIGTNAYSKSTKSSPRTTMRKDNSNTSASLKSNYSNTAFHSSGTNGIVNTNNGSTAELVHAYDAMSEIDSAAAAVHAAEAAAANSKLQATEKRNKFYFQCEMCSMVFTDRAQLLDHVPIHI